MIANKAEHIDLHRMSPKMEEVKAVLIDYSPSLCEL